MPLTNMLAAALDRLYAQAIAAAEGRGAAPFEGPMPPRQTVSPFAQPRLSGLGRFTRGGDDGRPTVAYPGLFQITQSRRDSTSPFPPGYAPPTRASSPILEIPMTTYVRNRIEIARQLSTHDECRAKIGDLMSDLGNRWKNGLMDDETVYTEMHRSIVALIDDALSRGDNGAADSAVHYVDERVHALKSARKLDAHTANRLNEESRAYLTTCLSEESGAHSTSRFCQPSLGWR